MNRCRNCIEMIKKLITIYKYKYIFKKKTRLEGTVAILSLFMWYLTDAKSTVDYITNWQPKFQTISREPLFHQRECIGNGEMDVPIN